MSFRVSRLVLDRTWSLWLQGTVCQNCNDLAGDIPRFSPIIVSRFHLPFSKSIIYLIMPVRCPLLIKIRLRVRLRLDETRSPVASSAAVLSRLKNVIGIQSELRLQLFVYRRVLAVRPSFITALVC